MKTTILSILLIASIQTFTGCREVSYNVKAVCVDKQVLCDKNGTPSFLTIFKIEDGSFKRTYGMANYYTSEVGKTYTFEESKFEWK